VCVYLYSVIVLTPFLASLFQSGGILSRTRLPLFIFPAVCVPGALQSELLSIFNEPCSALFSQFTTRKQSNKNVELFCEWRSGKKGK